MTAVGKITEICSADKCTGCGACIAKCPRQAVRLKFDPERLSRRTVVDDKLCIQCGICRQVCPVVTPPSRKTPGHAIALWLRDVQKAARSSSGGAAQGFTDYVLEQGGVVVGAGFTADGKLVHTIAETREAAANFCGSKYVQSDFSSVYSTVENRLKAGRTVLVFGTPCQIAGLYGFLGQEYDKLLTVDLVCHGVPAYDLFADYVREIIGSRHYTHVMFRQRNGFCFKLFDGSRKLYSSEGMLDWYLLAFMYGLSYRLNCYSCPYACPERVGDITLGDFWGIDYSALPELPPNRGISLALLHTDKGRKLFEAVKERFVWTERPVEEAVRGNNQLRTPFALHPDRAVFLKELKNRGIRRAAARTSLKKIYYKNLMKLPLRKIYHWLLDFHYSKMN
ncbi:Coenzyme F420 hydrogenase/dehydrogenase, beta subunit C-terminal domain [uncultured Victivallis sp.]|uniref:Coenzyme F420 hydrogenase/dehydrogenase, beta subunit C-terminal domain n=1 Tax=uncultured Victivallis sp. TaxID=354118 RepID=UPI002599E85C|nr:Coenzyme F420 hydrogenase/dehydrogenase, beta subunit C-terminal domain [uncultured Victivallis sp.]